MKKLVIELDPDVHKAFRAMCFAKGITMKQKLTGLILKSVEDAKK